MRIVIPSFDPKQRAYEVNVKLFMKSFLMNKTLGVVAVKKHREGKPCRGWVVNLHIPGYDSTKAYVIKGRAYDVVKRGKYNMTGKYSKKNKEVAK